MPTPVLNLTPLAANSIFTSGAQNVDVENPYVSVTVSSDQAGLLEIYEAGEGPQAPVKSISYPLAAGASLTVQIHTKQRRWWLTYTNGATPQTRFSCLYFSQRSGEKLTEENLLWLILKELRAHSMLLQALREPSAVGVNVPFGTDYQLST